MTQQVGVIGLGAMGTPIARNLVKAGIQTKVWNRSPKPAEELQRCGAVRATELEEILGCGVVLSTLFDDDAVRNVFLDSGILSRITNPTTHVCMSTISSTMAERLIEEHRRYGIQYVAAPMFGRPEAAAAAKLNIVVASDAKTLEQVEPVMRILGKTWRVGDDPRIAHIAKIAGNFMIGCAIETMAESAALISLNGGDAGVFFSMLNETLFNSFIHRSYGSAIAGGTFPGAPSGLQLPLKDVGLMLHEAENLGIRTPFAIQLRERLRLAEQKNLGHEDWSVALARIASTPETRIPA